MKPRSLIVLALLAAALAGCVIVPLEPYGAGPHRHSERDGYRYRGHERGGWR